MTALKLHLAKGLDLPQTAVTQTFAFMGKRGSGKTYAAGKLVEEMLDAGAQVVVIDPVGAWYGLRLLADGRRAGFPIPVLGGNHGDRDLVPEAGEIVADVVIDTGTSLVLDVSHFRKAEMQRFVTDCAEHLFRRKKTSRTPLHLVFEEAHLLVPQRVHSGQERMLGAMEDLVKLGRNYGIGASLLDQRPQSVNKDVLNQTEVLLAFQLIGSQERKAIELWAEDKGIGKNEMKRLSELDVGQAIVWSPTWLRIFGVYSIAKKRTYDASATPELGTATETRALAPVNLDALEKAMASVREERKSNDPKVYKKRIAELERENQRLALLAATPAVPTVTDFGFVSRAVAQLRALADMIEADAGKVAAKLASSAPVRPTNGHAVPTNRPREAPPASGRTGPEQRILDALAWLEAIGVTEPENATVAFLARYSPSSSSYTNPRGALRADGLVEYPGADRVRLTDSGRRLARRPETPPTDEQLQQTVLSILKGPEEKLLRVLLERWPDAVTNEDLAEATGYSPISSSFTNPRGHLRSIGLIEYPSPGSVVARDVLFPGARR